MIHQWMYQHADAMSSPNDVELPIVSMMGTLARLAGAYGQDGFLRRSVGEMLSSALDLLNADLGRLDGGALDTHIRQIAESIGYDLDVERFTDAR
jgi:hypothetical protein